MGTHALRTKSYAFIKISMKKLLILLSLIISLPSFAQTSYEFTCYIEVEQSYRRTSQTRSYRVRFDGEELRLGKKTTKTHYSDVHIFNAKDNHEFYFNKDGTVISFKFGKLPRPREFSQNHLYIDFLNAQAFGSIYSYQLGRSDNIAKTNCSLNEIELE